MPKGTQPGVAELRFKPRMPCAECVTSADSSRVGATQERRDKAKERTNVGEHLQGGWRATGFGESTHRGGPLMSPILWDQAMWLEASPSPRGEPRAIKRPARPGWAQETAGAHWDPFSSNANVSSPQGHLSCLGFPIAPGKLPLPSSAHLSAWLTPSPLHGGLLHN